MFTSRKQKIVKLFMLIKDLEGKNDKQTLNKYISQLKKLNLNKNEIKELEFEKYFQ